MAHKEFFRLTLIVGLIAVLAVFASSRPAVGAYVEKAEGLLSATDGLPGIRFLHVSTTDNVTGNTTYIDHPLINNDPNAVVFVTQNTNAGGSYSGTINEHEIGVWYSNTAHKWAIFNQDLTSFAARTDYNVLIPDAAATGMFVHTATVGNIVNNWTYIDHPLTNNNPDALLFITQNWNPGGTGGTYNDHPVGVWYSDTAHKWAIFNQDKATMPVDASFNILVAGADAEAFVHRATAETLAASSTLIDYAPVNDDTHALLFVTQNWNPGGVGGIYNPYSFDVYYNPLYGQWGINNLKPGMTIPMTEDAAFNVLVVHAPEPFFTHKATVGNTTNNSTFLDQPLLNNEPNAVALVTQNWNPGGGGGTYNNHPVGVWYNDLSSEWAIFNEDNVDMPAGAAFNVLIPNMDAGVFVHRATGANTSNNSTFIEHPLTDDDPNAIVFVTQNWNPGGGLFSGVYNAHPVGVWYNDLDGQWAVFNEDNVNMPVDASFNVFVPISDTTVFVHEATAGNSSGNSTFLDHPQLDGNPNARILITQNWNPGGGLFSGVYNAHPVGVWYSSAREQWAVFNQDGASMPVGAAFNVLVDRFKVYLPMVLRAP